MNLDFTLIIFMLCGVVVFCSTRNHILLALLSLEFIVLSVYFSLFLILLIYGLELYFSLIFLVFTVCEGALGLSLLVTLIRNQGNDYLSSMSVLTW
nr:NADH dehydrogenase subunit 4L [Microdeuterus sp. HEM078]